MTTEISVTSTFYDRVVSCKDFARNNGRDFPDLKYSQILDKAASRFYGYKSFSLIKAEYRKKVDGAATISGNGVAKCPVCDLTFSPQELIDINQHRKMHERFDDYYLATSYAPAGYADRESSKKAAYLALKAEDTESEVKHWEIILRSWFDRSLSRAIREGVGLKHPEYDAYCSMLISNLSPKPACINRLVDKFGIQEGVIPPGQTDWVSKR